MVYLNPLLMKSHVGIHVSTLKPPGANEYSFKGDLCEVQSMLALITIQF